MQTMFKKNTRKKVNKQILLAQKVFIFNKNLHLHLHTYSFKMWSTFLDVKSYSKHIWINDNANSTSAIKQKKIFNKVINKNKTQWNIFIMQNLND